MTLKMKQLWGVNSGRAVSSVVEHFLDTEGVTGSNPVSRTIFFWRFFFTPKALDAFIAQKKEGREKSVWLNGKALVGRRGVHI